MQLARGGALSHKVSLRQKQGVARDRLAVCQAQRRDVLAAGAASVLLSSALPSVAASLPPQVTPDDKLLCTKECLATLDSVEKVKLPSGLEYRDIVVGRGSNPPKGFQVVVHYIAMTPNGRIFDSSLDKGAPYDVRVGAGQIVAGLDEGLLTMKPGGVRRLYIPGNLSFPNGLKAAAGRPSVPPNSPVMFDVKLLYIPGMEDDEE